MSNESLNEEDDEDLKNIMKFPLKNLKITLTNKSSQDHKNDTNNIFAPSQDNSNISSGCNKFKFAMIGSRLQMPGS